MTNTTVGWVPEPDGRGTFGVLKSCVITLILCVYTVLHVNIHPAKATGLERFLTKAKWVLIGTLAPELVVFVAWCQRREAKRISATLNKIFQEKEEEGKLNKTRRYEWTTMHGFYAMMGGFVLKTDDPGEPPYIPGSPTLHLQHDGLKVLAHMDLIPDISQEYIKDKSKADGIAKVLVICQASWLVLQCIARWSAGLPLTALELNALAHTTSALIMYILWWEKPLDIQDPTVIDGDKKLVRALSAAIWACNLPDENNESLMSILWLFLCGKPTAYGNSAALIFRRIVKGCDLRQSKYISTCWLDLPVSKLMDIQTTEAGVIKTGPTDLEVTIDRWVYWNPKSEEHATTTPFIDISSGICYLARFIPPTPRDTYHLLESRQYQARWEDIYNLSIIGNPTWTAFQIKDEPSLGVQNHTTATWWSAFRLCSSSYPEVFTHLGVTLHRSILMVTPSGIMYPVRWSFPTSDPPTFVYWLSGNVRRGIVTHRVRNVSRNVVISEGKFGSSLLVLSACAVVYGGIHAAAWNDYFPTSAELLIWRISSVYIPAFTVFMMATFGTYLTFGNMGNMHSAYYDTKEWLHPLILPLFRATVGPVFLIEGFMGNIGVAIAMLLAALGLLAYLFFRAFLVIEAFSSLRSEREEVYQTPGWTRFLLHL